MPAGAPRLITALHVASYHNQEDMVQLLLDKGIKVRGVGAATKLQLQPQNCH
jgi:ankyrin repeat protein